MEIRVLGPTDATHLRAMLSMFGRAFDNPEHYVSAQPTDEYLTGLLSQSFFVAVAAMIEGEVVGGIAGYVLPKFEQARNEIYLYDLAVDERFRRRGIATQLINRLRTLAKERGAGTVYVQADPEDTPAVELYSKLGVREDVYHFDMEPLEG
jgi:aminoglycoside 3-N-acetyltransferase I